jgi:Zn-dependent protease/CBS domain-containing protein
MFTHRWRLFRVLGIPINIDASWLIILLLLTWTVGERFAEAIPGLSPAKSWVLGLITALGFFVCIVLHELGHAVVARKEGIPIRGITLFLFGGVAEMEGEPPSAGKEFAMAIAGPVVSALLAGLFFVLAAAGAARHWPADVVAMCEYLWMINIAVLVFNMVPAFPLDGGRVLRSFLWGVMGSLRRATYWAAMAGQGFAWFLIFLGILAIFNGAWPSGMWLGLIGLFLNKAASASYQQVLIRQLLKGEPIRRFMNRDPIAVPPSLSLRDLVEDYVYRYHHKAFPVVMDGRLEGVISTRHLADFPREEWPLHTVAEAMQTDLGGITLSPEADALQALERMQRQDVNRLLVTENNRLVGLISLKDLLRFLHLKLELEGEEPRSARSSDVPELRDEESEVGSGR